MFLQICLAIKKGEHQTERNLLEQEHCREAEVNCKIVEKKLRKDLGQINKTTRNKLKNKEVKEKLERPIMRN